MSLWWWTKRSVLLLCAGRSLRKTLETTRSPWKRSHRWWEKDLKDFFWLKTFSLFLSCRNDSLFSCWNSSLCVCVSVSGHGGLQDGAVREPLRPGDSWATHAARPPGLQGHPVRVSAHVCVQTHTLARVLECYSLLAWKNLFFYSPCSEFFGQGWMKNDKNERTPYIMITTKHFNSVRRNLMHR